MNTIRKLIEKFKRKAQLDVMAVACVEGMRERNEARMNKIKESMGTKYICHPDNMKSRLDTPRPV